ncbi:MAG: srtA [Amycolatopsis sp.]|nr:srtA [Amycolatopsis sp.]
MSADPAVTESAVTEPVVSESVSVGPRWIAAVAGIWLVVSGVCLTLVIYAIGPMLENSDQEAALGAFRGEVNQALGATQSLSGAAAPTKPAEFGAPVAVLEIPKLHVQQVVVEGVSPSETASGPGHVPGTSGLGQPGNAAVAGRYSGYGAPFGRLGELRAGDEIVVATTQGSSLYRVTGTATRDLNEDTDYGRTDNDRLTLVTSASWWPLASTSATVVTANLEGRPFRPAPQNGRADAQDGRTGESAAWALLVLSFGAFSAVAFGATWLYRRWRPVSTYVITAPALLALAALSAISLWRLLPAWT